MRNAPLLSANGRALHGLVAVGAGLVLGSLAALEPDARGHGTHEQLGLPPCALMTVAGVPCPLCGMTTAAAHLVRADVTAALSTQPAGAILALAGLAGMLLVAGSAIAGRSLVIPALERPSGRIVAAVALLLALSWIYKIFTL